MATADNGWDGARAVGATTALVMALLTPAQASVVTLGFEQFADLDSITNQVPGITFSNATILSSGLSLNDSEFPPHSGSNVVFDDGGGMVIGFVSPVFSVSAYVTYASASGLTFDVFDSADHLLAHLTSQFKSNLATSGDAGSAPNEFFQYAGGTGNIAKVVITADALGNSFTMDDLGFDNGPTNSVPEPATLGLVAPLLGMCILPGGWPRRRRVVR